MIFLLVNRVYLFFTLEKTGRSREISSTKPDNAVDKDDEQQTRIRMMLRFLLYTVRHMVLVT